MKIAILLNTSWYIYNFRRNMIQELISRNYEVHAIAPYDEYTIKLEALGCFYHSIEFDSKSKNPLSDISLLLKLKKKLKIISPDVLLNFTIKPNIYGSLAAYSLKIPVINNIAGMGTLFSESMISRTFFKMLFKISQNKANTVFFQNPDDFRELTVKNIVSRDIAKLLPGSGVNLDEFSYFPLSQTKIITFLLIARMIYPKGIEELFAAGKLLKEKGFNNFRIKLLGETGVNNPAAIPAERIKEINSCEFVDYLGKTDDVVSHIKNATAIVLPSYYREGTPKSLLEALAVGRPVITTEMPGCRETVINGQNGYLCKASSVKSLAEKLEDFITLSDEQKIKMGAESRKLAEKKFDEKIVIDKYLQAIENALS
ncbi:MAG: glycosyltransferase family 4 protein [Bacteroidota bacterium]